ncbi:formimidoylglutamase [Lewinella sp. 4G2]|uniref:formimidoylglutamase n=1 Tax=Lewinella sp. 4G2 TaxID=1803372 RepID=UPI0007B48D87|nr:formimidoylglutamase [Lewinella sp. 4G2]OAV44124.1 formimidoylglutamase [Lewinella sp. 4G2]
MSNYYQPADASLWTGRSVDPRLGPQYWYQSSSFLDLSAAVEAQPDLKGQTVILGYAVEEGVRRNQGRIGAAAGPDTARPYLGRLAEGTSPKRRWDAGNIICPDGNLEAAQEELALRVSQICQAGGKPIVIGGGHDIAYGHFRGLYDAHNDPGRTFGIINFDAHFDLRSPTNGATSGTPFRQILTEMGGNVRYLAAGIQAAANTPELFRVAEKYAVNVLSDETLYANPERSLRQLAFFAASVDHLYLTIDLDTFPAGVAPGVSAPNPTGVDPHFVLGALAELLSIGNTVGMDIAEFNPRYDRDGVTARLVSRLVHRADEYLWL